MLRIEQLSFQEQNYCLEIEGRCESEILSQRRIIDFISGVTHFYTLT